MHTLLVLLVALIYTRTCVIGHLSIGYLLIGALGIELKIFTELINVEIDKQFRKN